MCSQNVSSEIYVNALNLHYIVMKVLILNSQNVTQDNCYAVTSKRDAALILIHKLNPSQKKYSTNWPTAEDIPTLIVCTNEDNVIVHTHCRILEGYAKVLGIPCQCCTLNVLYMWKTLAWLHLGLVVVRRKCRCEAHTRNYTSEHTTAQLQQWVESNHRHWNASLVSKEVYGLRPYSQLEKPLFLRSSKIWWKSWH